MKRGIASFLAVAAVLQFNVARSAPADVFSAAAPVSGADAPKPREIKDGDATVSTQTGALSWAYPIAVPPGRNGVAPSLALSYSSQAGIYGGIATGFAWNLGIPEIREDTSESRLKTHSPLIELLESNPGADDRFVGLGGRRLVPSEDPKPAGVYKTYRAMGDDKFERYERASSGRPFWRVRSLEGSVMEFGGTTAVCANVGEGFAPLTRTLDVFGNEIVYTFEEEVSGECRLKSIDWGGNTTASVGHFARVELTWSEPATCNGIAVGSQVDYRSGKRIVTGASRLATIRVIAFPPGQPGAPVHTRQVGLQYSSQHMQCNRPHAPLRLLSSIQESAWITGAPSVDLPPVTLEYSDPVLTFANPGQAEPRPWSGPVANNIAWGYRYPSGSDQAIDRSPTVEAMFVDLDGDGLLDRLYNTSNETVDGVCRAVWQKNLGAPAGSTQPQFSGSSELTLPRLKWHGQPTAPPWTGSPPRDGGNRAEATRGEKCSLAGQVTAFWNSENVGGSCHNGLPGGAACRAASNPNDLSLYCDPNGRECPASGFTPSPRTYLHYRWMDADGDGLTDLVAAAHGDIRTYDIEQGNHTIQAPPPAEPTLFGPWPACPTQLDRCKNVNPDCITGAHGDLVAINQCIVNAATVGCDKLIDTAEGAPSSTNRGPYTRCEGLYPWFIFKNTGNGVFAAPTIKYQPVPLESDAGDSNLGPLTGVVSGRHAVTDFDGDGILDAVVKPNPQWGHFWWVWFGDGTGGFEPKRYIFFARPDGFVSQSSWSPLVSVSTTESIFDLNGDGLLDHWQEISGQGNASVWFNTGTEHSSTTALVTPYSSGSWAVKPGNDTSHAITAYDFVAPNPPANPSPRYTYYAGTTRATNRVFDVDGDGRPDVVKDVTTASPKVFFNLGGQFNAPGVLYPPLPGGAANLQGLKRLTNVVGVQSNPEGQWYLLTDHIDLDGDSIPEIVDFETGSYKRARQTNIAPPRLLTKIHNGRGAHVSVAYASLHDKTTVEQNPGSYWTDRWGAQRPNSSPRAQWVVKAVTSTDDFSNTSSTSTYFYKHPRHGSDDEGRFAFRGFQEVATTAPSGSKTIERYAYDVDWSGRLTETLIKPSTNEMTVPDEVRSITRVRWEERPLFNNALRTHHATLTERFTCANDQTETDCKASAPAYSRTTTTLEALIPEGGAAPLIWQPKSSLLQAGTMDADGDRITTTEFKFVAVGEVYRLRPLSTERRVRNGNALDLYAKSQTKWDPDDKVKLEEQVWFDANRSVTTRYQYDMATGNLTKRWKPKQYAANKSTTYTYDSRKLFIATEVNELGHRVDHTYEYGTGTKLMTQGPNQRTCATGTGCPLDATHPLKEQSKVVVDGLGRTIETWDTISDDGVLYELVQRSTTTYVDTPSGTTPTSVTSRTRLDTTSSVWTQERTDVDGHGRPIKVTAFAQGSAAADSVTVYAYRNDGTLSTVQVPDPRANNSTRVTYTYTFDSLGRPTSVRRPDGADPSTDQSGVDFFYNGVLTTSAPVIPANTGGGEHGVLVNVTDSFGRVTQVVEGQIFGAAHVTTYAYGPDDSVRTIVDPEGVTTTLKHDFAGHRKEITRHGRTWKYEYDDNGNPESELVPGSPSAATDIDYTTTVIYDHLDRPLEKIIGQRSLTSQDQALFANKTEKFEWDIGGNMIGHLRYWRSYAPNQATAAIVHSTRVNNQGQLVTAIQNMQIAGYPSLERRFGLRYNLFGGVAETRYEDQLGGTNKTIATTHYDARALPTHMVLKRTGQVDQTVAAQTRNVAGLVTKRRTDTTGSMTFVESNWSYDVLGRITSQVVQKGPGPVPIVRQELSYTGHDNPKTLTHYLGGNSKLLNFTYDFRHQLKTVTSGTPGYFGATYNYGPGGRFTRATETQTISPLPPGTEVKPRDVNYVYGDADPERVTALTRVSDGSTYAGYSYDAAGNMLRRCYGGSGVPSCAGESTEYVYDGKDQLRRATKRVGGVVQGSEEYWYGGNGQRIAVVKRDAGNARTEMIWFIGDVQAHYNGTGGLSRIYSHLSLGTPVARVERTSNTAATVEYQFHGLASNTIAAVAHSGTINASFNYTPFGAVIEKTNGGGLGAGFAAHLRRFNDKYEDSLTGLGYYGARYYDKTLLGWTQADPLYLRNPDAAKQSIPRRSNLYQFTLSNPLRYVDPDGLDSRGHWTRGSQADLDFALKRQQKGATYGGGWSGPSIESGGAEETNAIDCGSLAPGLCEAGAIDDAQLEVLVAAVASPGEYNDDLYASRGGVRRPATVARRPTPATSTTNPATRTVPTPPRGYQAAPVRGQFGGRRSPAIAPSGTAPSFRRMGAQRGGAQNRVRNLHHVFPEQFREFFEARNINIDMYTVSVSMSFHLSRIHGRGGWNQQWASFIRANPNATQEQVLTQGINMMNQFRINRYVLQPYR